LPSLISIGGGGGGVLPDRLLFYSENFALLCSSMGTLWSTLYFSPYEKKVAFSSLNNSSETEKRFVGLLPRWKTIAGKHIITFENSLKLK
jgi:hypothetical protein